MAEKKYDTQSEQLEIVKSCKIFASLDEAVLLNLITRLEKVELVQGETLFVEGDFSDSLYILITGRLVATLMTKDNDIKVVGFVEPGETVGELGVLSSHPRTLTIRALEDSKFFKLANQDFFEFLRNNTPVMLEIIDSIVSRSQQNIKLLAEKIHRHVAIIAANDTVNIDHFFVEMRKNLPNKEVILLSDLDETVRLSEKEIIQKIETAEKKRYTILYFIKNDKSPLAKVFSKKVESVFIVTEAKKEQQGNFSNFVSSLLKQKKLRNEIRFELILLHEHSSPVYKNTKAWLAGNSFYICHHVCTNELRDYQRLSRFMTGKAIGVVFGGGGAKAWAAMGVLKALIEKGVNIDAVGGTSAGAFVAACYAKFENFEDLFAKFKYLADAIKYPFALYNFTWPIVSILNGKNGTDALRAVFEDTHIEDLRIPFFCVSSNLTTTQETVHYFGKLWEKIRASVALPGIIPPLVIDNDLHVDGGLLNNLPVDVMQQLLGYSSIIIAVSLVTKEKTEEHYDFPPTISFKLALAIQLGLIKKTYKFPPLLDTFFKALLIGASNKERMNSLQADILIAPSLTGIKIFSLTEAEAKTALQDGYNDAIAKISQSDIL